ncbi:MAG TPA: hypothetical protein PKZ12_01545 [Smithellaceae bacterium]|nr:hypothetical protein [Smithellaceae bacterium]
MAKINKPEKNPETKSVSIIYEETMRELVICQEQAAAFLRDKGMRDIEQTKITLFLQSTKLANSLILPRIEFQKIEWQPYKFFNHQIYKNIQSSYLLAKATNWTRDWNVYAQYSRVAASFWDQADIGKYIVSNFETDETGVKLYEFLAFSHALLSEIRITPIVVDLPPDNYIGLLSEIEEENGRQIQLQVRLLKNMAVPLTLDEKEDISLTARIKLGEVYRRFLVFLCEQ